MVLQLPCKNTFQRLYEMTCSGCKDSIQLEDLDKLIIITYGVIKRGNFVEREELIYYHRWCLK
ncbi:MAG: hypothetical protein ACFFAS_12935 [Promethearchaeota archaeon]